MSWKERNLAELIDLHDHIRIPLSGVEREKRQGEFPYYGAQSVIDHIDAYLFDGDYVLIAEDGENLRSRKQPIAQIVRGKFWVNNHAHILTAKQGVSNNSFIRALINWIDISPYVTGAAQPKLSQGSLRSIKVRVPDSETQLQISTVIDAYDDLIETSRRRIALLEESAHLLYREWFVNRRFPGHEHVKMVKGAPAGWSVQPLSALIDVNPKTSFEKDKSYPFVPMQSLSETSMSIGDREERIISGGAKFQNLDTLLARITPCLENGKTGFVQFLDDDAPVASGSTEFIVMRSRTVSPYWVYCLARDEAFREHAIGSMAGSDGRQRVNTKCFDSYLTFQPPEEILLEFDCLMKPVFEEVEVLARMNKRLQEARDELLPKLMSGAITV